MSKVYNCAFELEAIACFRVLVFYSKFIPVVFHGIQKVEYLHMQSDKVGLIKSDLRMRFKARWFHNDGDRGLYRLND